MSSQSAVRVEQVMFPSGGVRRAGDLHLVRPTPAPTDDLPVGEDQ
ncbi:hypothetical protein [Goodfellowiella coeruleoviolacea]|nr:hypothetical protein [Goodfellowiella coeruleoviolacea]